MADSTTFRARVVAPEISAVLRQHPALQRLEGASELVTFDQPPGSTEEFLDRVSGAQVLIGPSGSPRWATIDFRAFPDLLLISAIGVGIDTIDLAAATRAGVAVCNTPGANARSVAEHTFALVLSAVRHIARNDRELRVGVWARHPSFELEGKTLGVLGLGDIGQLVARMAGAFGMRVLAWSRRHDPARASACGAALVDQETLFRESDVLCLLVALTPETRHILNTRTLGMMKPGSVVVNTGRGGLVDEEALATALQDGTLSAAGLDVFEVEPLEPGHPFTKLENVVLTPHSAWNSREASQRLFTVPIENIEAFLRGEPQNICNPEALAHPRHAGRPWARPTARIG